MISSSTLQARSGADSYTDLSSLNAIRTLGRADKDQALEKIAQQFESMMVQMMMKSMRQANEAFSKDSMLASSAGDMYQDMYDDQIALSLSQGRGLGIAEVMVRQLRSRFGEEKVKDVNHEIAGYMDRKVEKAETNISIPLVDKGIVNTSNTAKSEGVNDSSFNKITFDGSVEKFVSNLYPLAQKAAQKIGVAPEVLLAQSALETGWGKKINTHSNGESSFNFFNIKADNHWQGKTLAVNTVEFKQGVAVREQATFRSYPHPQQSFDDYVDFLTKSSRYNNATSATNNESFIKELSNAGYATDPEYADKIIRIMKSDSLKQAMVEIKSSLSEG